MSIPYGLWGTIPTAPLYNVPSLLPSSSLLVTDPAGAIRDYAEHVMSGDRRSMAPAEDIKRLEEWCKNEEYRKVIVEVVKSRLDLGWPYNYKALDVCGVIPVGNLLGLLEQLTKLNESAASVEGAAEIKKLAKPLVDKANGEKKKQEEEEFAKQQAAIAAMWGGLWHNAPAQAQLQLGNAGWGGYPYPYNMVPGTAAAVPPWQAVIDALGTPEGWTPSKIMPIPQLYPFSRAGYYAMLPDDKNPAAPPARKPYWINVGLEGNKRAVASQSIPLGLEELWGEVVAGGDARGFFTW